MKWMKQSLKLAAPAVQKLIRQLAPSKALDQNLSFSNYDLQFPDLPSDFDGLKIAHLSDLHGSRVPSLLHVLRTMQPDLILGSGDLYDGKQHAFYTTSLLLEAASIAPVFLCEGNHETFLKEYPAQKQILKQAGIHVLDDSSALFCKGRSCLEIAGLKDPGDGRMCSQDELKQHLERQLEHLPLSAKNLFRILLLHRADLLDEIPEGRFDLILSGHLHGGHWRLGNLGVLAPRGKGLVLFPKRTAGVHSVHKTAAVISRGLGDQMQIPRLNNPPELVCIRLHVKK